MNKMLIFKKVSSRVIRCHQMSKRSPNHAERRELKSLAFFGKFVFGNVPDVGF